MQAPFADPLLGLERLRTSLPMVGRDMEMQAMHDLLNAVNFDLPVGPRALIISGEMGVGKTRLLATFCQEARENGLRVLEASAYESGRMFPYLPFIDALRPVIHSSSKEQLRDYTGITSSSSDLEEHHHAGNGREARAVGTISVTGAPLVAALSRLFPELLGRLQIKRPAEEPLSPEQEMFRLLDAIATLLERIALQQPILLCIDNLQWADSGSLNLTLYLTNRLRSSRVGLVGVTRLMGPDMMSDEPGAAAAAMAALRVLGDLMRERALMHLALAPLSEVAAEQHLQALLPGLVPQPVAQELLKRAEGNPFFLEELVRTQTLQHQLVLHKNTWRVAHTGSVRLPDSIVLAIKQRLQGLSASCSDLLQTAALFGRTFPLDALVEVTTSSLHRLQPLIDEALAARVIAVQPQTAWAGSPSVSSSADQGHDDEKFMQEMLSELEQEIPLQRYIFCQGIVQEVLQADIPSYKARPLHSAIGNALENSYAQEASAHAAELARHYALGGEREETIRWSLVAGANAVRQGGHREAIKHFLLVLNLIEKESGRSQGGTGEQRPSIAELYVTIGELWTMLSEFDQAIKCFQQALQHASGEPPLLLARANRHLSDVYRLQARFDQAMAHIQAASAALDESVTASRHPTATQKEVTHFSSSWQSGWHSGQHYSSSIVEVDQQPVSIIERIHFLQSQAVLHIMLNRLGEAETALWQSHHLATEIGDRGSQAFALWFVGYLRGWGEQIHEAIRLQEQALELYVEIGNPLRAAMGDHMLGIYYQALGDIERARLYTLRGIERVKRHTIRRFLGWLLWSQGIIELGQGNWESCANYLQQALQEALSYNETRLKPIVFQAQAVLQFRRGNWEEAEQLFLDSIQAAPSTEWYPSTVALYGHFLAVTGRRASAHSQLMRVAEVTEKGEPPGIAGNFYIPFLAEGFLHLEEASRASSYIERIRNLRGFMYYGNSVDRILGTVAAHIGDWEAADHAFEDGLVLCRRAHNQPEEGAILFEQARIALRRGAPVTRVHELCEQARTIFQQYGMLRAVDMVNTLQEGARQLASEPTDKGGVNVHTQTKPATIHELEVHLTRRELEVLRLVAQGNTDRQIADLLTISTRTANRHLSNIFVKLDVPGRAAAVAYAIRMGLVK